MPETRLQSYLSESYLTSHLYISFSVVFDLCTTRHTTASNEQCRPLLEPMYLWAGLTCSLDKAEIPQELCGEKEAVCDYIIKDCVLMHMNK